MRVSGKMGGVRFVVLKAVRVWRPILKISDSQLAFCGDALGCLHDAVSFKARDPMLNRIMAELALQVAPMGFIVSVSTLGLTATQRVLR